MPGVTGASGEALYLGSQVCLGSPGAWICPKDSDSVGPEYGLTFGISEKSPGNLNVKTHTTGLGSHRMG